MKLSAVKILPICPWALREGILLRYLEDGADSWADMERYDAPGPTLNGGPLGSTARGHALVGALMRRGALTPRGIPDHVTVP